ncbi:MAG: 30S ribosomal protein S4 [Christensenellales bacterium]|jgi:small subunit ribosomal protein S4|nr:30S ribosomal protein S4 [Eubacteriales bacterium]MCI6029399.1 30S ribosomal protein S4 [Clostridiales bacterium]MDD7414816.1 30S ribosomal protein S4 [Clostridiales bacterium]MDY5732578.1 30S ribosomal protein S4 [Eubacteriales bacterium]
MARYTDSVCRQCRREGIKLFLKGDRCYSAKCAITKRHTPPGQHGQSRAKKPSEYGLQLREKQKCRRAYGVLESQFRKYYDMAANMRGVTGDNMLSLLERRLDNVAFRLGFGNSRAMARQLVTHGHILVDGKKVDIPSYLVKPGQVISVRSKSRDMQHLKELREQGSKNTIPKWLELDAENLSGKVMALPQRDDIDLTLEEHLIVEFYSR